MDGINPGRHSISTTTVRFGGHTTPGNGRGHARFGGCARYDCKMSLRDVLIVGAGPSGLATAIAAKQHGLDYVIVEKGVLVNSIFRFPINMIFFTTPELLE